MAPTSVKVVDTIHSRELINFSGDGQTVCKHVCRNVYIGHTGKAAYNNTAMGKENVRYKFSDKTLCSIHDGHNKNRQ